MRVSASFAKITRSSLFRTTTPSLSSSRIVSISRSQSGVSRGVIVIVLFISIANPLQVYRLVCIAQFSRVTWNAVDQPRDRGEQEANRYPAHQHSRHALQRPQESPPAGKGHVAITHG